MPARLGSVVLVSLALAVSACGSEDKTATVTPSPTPPVTPATPYVSPAPQTVTVTYTNRPTPSITYKSQSDLLSDLGLNRAKWNAAGITDYQFGFTLRCFCFYENQPTTMLVRNGESVSMTDTTGAPVTPGPTYDDFSRYSTVERMFQQIDTELPEASGVVVTYDEQYGFPTEILIGAHGYGTDSGSNVTISQFEVLQ